VTIIKGKVRIEKRLGGGGMAEVFLARVLGAEGFTRVVAVKRVLPHFSQDPQFSAMFVNEARLSSQLQHPSIVQVLDFDRDEEGRLYLMMELVDGKDLDAIAHRGPLPIPIIIYVIGEVLEGLSYAHDLTSSDGHRLGIVHRDVSPQNVLCSWNGVVKVSDFGIAKAVHATGVNQSGTVKGKPRYMSPEQVLSPGAIDARADVFAVGVMLFELLTGQTFYQGTTNEEILTDVIQVARGWRAIVPAQTTRPDLPWDLVQVVHKMTAPDRNHRFQSAREALDALLRCQAAPVRGATLLAQCLAERFPGDAQARGRASIPAAAVVTPPRPVATGPEAGTMLAPESRSQPMTLPLPAAAPTPTPYTPQPIAIGSGQVIPTAGSVSSSATAAPRRRGALLAVAIAAILSVGIAVAAVVIARRDQGDRVGAPADPSPRTASVVDAAPAAAEPDAAVAVAVATPVDAAPAAVNTAPADVASPDDASKHHHHRPKDQKEPKEAKADREDGQGILVVTARPWAVVRVDGRSLGQTPVSHTLSAGQHKLVLEKPDGTTETVKVEIHDDHTTRIERSY